MHLLLSATLCPSCFLCCGSMAWPKKPKPQLLIFSRPDRTNALVPTHLTVCLPLVVGLPCLSSVLVSCFSGRPSLLVPHAALFLFTFTLVTFISFIVADLCQETAGCWRQIQPQHVCPWLNSFPSLLTLRALAFQLFNSNYTRHTGQT